MKNILLQMLDILTEAKEHAKMSSYRIIKPNRNKAKEILKKNKKIVLIQNDFTYATYINLNFQKQNLLQKTKFFQT